jgi:RNA polymerase sigma-70 factor (ECF subfamily)
LEGVEVEHPRPDPEAQADTVESLERLHAALMELPLVCRDAFLMNRIDAMTHTEIATRLGISTKSVQRYVERALRHCLRVVDP